MYRAHSPSGWGIPEQQQNYAAVTSSGASPVPMDPAQGRQGGESSDAGSHTGSIGPYPKQEQFNAMCTMLEQTINSRPGYYLNDLARDFW